MNEISKGIVMGALIFIVFFIMFATTKINNKLFDIREQMNGTCIHATTYSGECKGYK